MNKAYRFSDFVRRCTLNQVDTLNTIIYFGSLDITHWRLPFLLVIKLVVTSFLCQTNHDSDDDDDAADDVDARIALIIHTSSLSSLESSFVA